VPSVYQASNQSVRSVLDNKVDCGR
jgi:hypothetical protein